ncbi:diguanylate cyclase, partial [Nonomuraea muscovyensis]
GWTVHAIALHRRLAAAKKDPLTGLLRRDAYTARGRRILARHRGDTTVVMVDADRFKAINDTLGHAAGDTVLVAVAAQDRLPVPGGAGFARRTGMLADPADVVRESAERVAAAGLVVDLVLDPAADRSPLVARASAARIIQEGLTNVLKHAGPGTEVRVALATTGRGLSIEIHNGRPPGHVERLPSSGRGLAGMRERIRALGGTLAAGPDGDGGWRLAAFLPTARSTTPGSAMALSAPRSHALDPGGGAEDGAGEWTEGGAGSRASAGARPGDAG